MASRRLAPRLMLTVALSAAFVAARASGRDEVAAAAVAILVTLAATPALRAAPRAAVAAGAAAGTAWLAALPGVAAVALGLLPVAINLALLWHFGATLRPGAEPLIARYTRADFGRLPAECAPYARALTRLWVAVFGLLALANAAPLAFGAPDPGMMLAASGATVLTLFLGEHLVRGLRFPHLGPVSPLRTLRAVRLAHQGGRGEGLRHAG